MGEEFKNNNEFKRNINGIKLPVMRGKRFISGRGKMATHNYVLRQMEKEDEARKQKIHRKNLEGMYYVSEVFVSAIDVLDKLYERKIISKDDYQKTKKYLEEDEMYAKKNREYIYKNRENVDYKSYDHIQMLPRFFERW